MGAILCFCTYQPVFAFMFMTNSIEGSSKSLQKALSIDRKRQREREKMRLIDLLQNSKHTALLTYSKTHLGH